MLGAHLERRCRCAEYPYSSKHRAGTGGKHRRRMPHSRVALTRRGKVSLFFLCKYTFCPVDGKLAACCEETRISGVPHKIIIYVGTLVTGRNQSPSSRTYLDYLTGGLPTVCHGGTGGRFLLLPDADWNSHEHYGVGPRRVQVPGLCQVGRTSFAALLGGMRRNTLGVSVLRGLCWATSKAGFERGTESNTLVHPQKK